MKRPAITAMLLTLVMFAGTAMGEVSEANRKKIVALRLELKKASSLFVGKNYDQSGKAIEKIQGELQAMAKDAKPDLLAVLEPLHKALGRAHAALEIKGVKITPLQPLGKATATPSKPDQPLPPGAISFTKQVAPILVAKCGNCHVRNARGMFSMANYDVLMKGNNDGKVLFAGDSKNSRIIEVIESGDMPRGGLKVSAAERQTLEKWIDSGAKFDGADPKANLASLAPNVSSDLPKVELKKATGKETVSFAADIAPVLNEHCANCHGNGRRPSGRFNLTNMTAMIRGGESGPPFVPGKADESLIIQKLTAPKSGQRMPLRQPALPPAVIAKIKTWINEGATFDGPDPAQHIQQVAALAMAKAATHEELSQYRVDLAEKNWKLGMADIEASSAETENFFIMGNFGEAVVGQYAERAEAVAPKVAEMFGAPSDKPLFKGRMSLFMFRQRYDYSEFGKMVEKRDLPRSWRGHWRFNIVDSYGAMVPPRAEEYGVDPLMTEYVAGAYVASLGDVPRWFAEGAGRVAASRTDPDDARVKQWSDELPEVFKTMQKSDDFITGKLPPDAAAIASFSFIKYLMGRDSKRFKQLLGEIRQGSSFGDAFGKVYRASPAQLTAAWGASAARKNKRRR